MLHRWEKQPCPCIYMCVLFYTCCFLYTCVFLCNHNTCAQGVFRIHHPVNTNIPSSFCVVQLAYTRTSAPCSPEMLQRVYRASILATTLRHGMSSLPNCLFPINNRSAPLAAQRLKQPVSLTCILGQTLTTMKQPKLAAFFQPKPAAGAPHATPKDADVLREVRQAVHCVPRLHRLIAGGDV